MKKVILLIALLSSGFFMEMKINKNLNADVAAVQLDTDTSSKDSLASSIVIDSITK